MIPLRIYFTVCGSRKPNQWFRVWDVSYVKAERIRRAENIRRLDGGIMGGMKMFMNLMEKT